MINEIKQHLGAYLALCMILTLFVVGFLWFWPQVWLLRAMIVSLGIAYIAWGVLAHIKTKRITTRVVFEYAAMSLIACLLLWMLTI